MDKEEKDSIDRLKSELYSRTPKIAMGNDVRAPLSQPEEDVPHAWAPAPVEKTEEPKLPPIAQLMEEMEHPKKKMSFSAKFLIASLLFFIIAAGIAAYMFFVGSNVISPQNIDVEVAAPSLVDGGKPATLQVVITNRNKGALSSANLIIDYPDGTRDPRDSTKLLSHDRIEIGELPSCSQTKQGLSAVFYGQQGVQETVKATLEYTIEGSGALFRKETDVSFLIGSSPVSVAVHAPTDVVSGQPFTLDITVQASGAASINDVVMQAQYPSGFSVSSTDPAPLVGSSLWRLGTLQPGTPKTIHVTGVLEGQDGDQRVFRFLSGSDSNPTNVTVEVPFLSIPTVIAIQKPFLSATIALNGQSGKTVALAPGEQVEGIVTYTNNLQTAVSNATLKLNFKGDTVDFNSINASGGFYQSSDGTIIWSPQTDSQLASVPAGGTGTERFTFSTIPPSSSRAAVNPTINLSLGITGSRTDATGVVSDVTTAATAQASVASLVTLTTLVHHFIGAFANSGPMPPKVGQRTTYTIEWAVRNSSNSIANARVTTALPPYITFIAAEPGSGISYEPSSRIVTWQLGDIKAGVGYGSDALRASFQVSMLPSVSQVGQTPTLSTAAELFGQDRFTQTPVHLTSSEPNIQLSSENGYVADMGRVSQ